MSVSSFDQPVGRSKRPKDATGTGSRSGPSPAIDRIADLQGTAGNVAVATMLSTGPRPKELRSKDVMARLRKLPVVDTRLQEVLRQGPTALDHVKRQLAMFDEHLARKATAGQYVNEAIRIATVVDAVSGQLAKVVNDPTLKGRIATELIAAHRTELDRVLGGANPDPGRTRQNTKALDLAAAITSDDPVMHYLQDKVKPEDAAWRIRSMAAAGGLLAGEMFRVLSERAQLQLGTLSRQEVDAGKLERDVTRTTDPTTGRENRATAGFDLDNLIGEIAPDVYTATVNTAPATGKSAKKPQLPAWARGGVDLQAGAKQRLDLLEAKVRSIDLERVALSDTKRAAEQAKSGTGLSEAQTLHFARLRGEEADTAADYEGTASSPAAYAAAAFMKRYAIGDRAAARLVTQCVTALATVPLTLTNELEKLFGVRDDGKDEPTYGSVYTSEPARMQQQVDLGALVGRPEHDAKAMAIGRPDPGFTASRGENYMRWRRDKDERETGYHGLSADELPTFAAVNPNFHVTKGGSGNTAMRDAATAQYINAYGKNYYGDVHFLLRDAVRPRSTFIARGKKQTKGHRIERTDLTLLLADMVRMNMGDYLDALVAQVAGTGETVLTNMDAEVHIYGTFDLAKDVSAMYLQPDAFAATDGAAARAKAFAQANGIAVHDIGKQPDGFTVWAKQEFYQGGIDLKAALAGTPPNPST